VRQFLVSSFWFLVSDWTTGGWGEDSGDG
jgi:hypothetical protein